MQGTGKGFQISDFVASPTLNIERYLLAFRHSTFAFCFPSPRHPASSILPQI